MRPLTSESTLKKKALVIHLGRHRGRPISARNGRDAVFPKTLCLVSMRRDVAVGLTQSTGRVGL